MSQARGSVVLVVAHRSLPIAHSVHRPHPFRPSVIARDFSHQEAVTMSSQSPGSSWGRRLMLETLESRTNPSRVLREGDTLIIIGTQDADTVAITDDGQGGLSVTFDNTASGSQNGGSNSGGSSGGSSGSNGSDSNGDNGGGGGTVTQSFTGVDEVIFLGLRGDDVFTYDLTGPLSSDLDLTLLMGAGNNQATVNAADGIDADARLRVDVKGNGGDDDVSVDLGAVGDDAGFELDARLGGGADALDLTQTGDIGAGAQVETRVQAGSGDDTVDVSFDGNAAADSELTIRLSGGSGDDDLTALFTGETDGSLNLRAGGGDGNDTVASEITLVGTSEGEIRARVQGNDGDDDLTLNIVDPGGAVTLTTAILDGGDGMDTATNTANVTVLNVP
jgi:hypothetical protein